MKKRKPRWYWVAIIGGAVSLSAVARHVGGGDGFVVAFLWAWLFCLSYDVYLGDI